MVNALKRDYQDVADPFTLNKDTFLLDFPSLIVRVNPTLEAKAIRELEKTIQRLKLNSDNFINDRSNWLKPYCLGEASFPSLKKYAPFIAYELERQDLIEKIKTIMDYKLEGWE